MTTLDHQIGRLALACGTGDAAAYATTLREVLEEGDGAALELIEGQSRTISLLMAAANGPRWTEVLNMALLDLDTRTTGPGA